MVLLVSFRTWQGMLLPIATGMLSTVWGLGLMAATGVPLGLVNQSVPTLVVIIAAGYYQQVQTTRTRKDSSQEQSAQMQGVQNALKFMPIFFGFISWSLPTGLDLYFGVSNIFRIGQQAWILRLDRPDEGGKPAKVDESDGLDPGNGDSRPGQPSPNASKKRKGRRRK